MISLTSLRKIICSLFIVHCPPLSIPTAYSMKTTYLKSFLGLTALLLLFSCNLLKNQVDRIDIDSLLAKTQPRIDSLSISAGRYATIGASERAELLSKSLIQGLKGSVDTLDPDIQKIFRTIDSIGNLSNEQLVKMGMTLDSSLNNLKASIEDKEFRAYLVSTIEMLTGRLRKDTKYLLSDMIQASLDSLGTGSSKDKVRKIISDLLGEDTKAQAQSLVQGALQPTMDTFLARIDKIVHKDVPFVQRQANKLLLMLGLIAAGIIGFVWYQRRKYARLVNLLTYEIDKMPSQEQYDDLTNKIKSEAQKNGLEPLLRDVLKEQGINN